MPAPEPQTVLVHLHRMPGRTYQVADSGLWLAPQIIQGARSAWRLCAREPYQFAWLHTQGLYRASFPTLHEARRTLTAHLTLNPLPAYTPVTLYRLGTGRYRTADHAWEITRAANQGWDITRSCETNAQLQSLTTYSACQTLQEARRRITRHQQLIQTGTPTPNTPTAENA